MQLVAFILAIVMPLGGIPAAAVPVTPSGNAHKQAPAVVENGTDLELFEYPNNVPLPFAFAPDGSAYAIWNSNYLVKIASDGTTSFIQIHFPVQNHATRYGSIVYADGYLWFQSFEGYIHMKPDGTNVTYHQQQFANAIPAPGGIYVSFNGIVEFVNGTTFVRTQHYVAYPGSVTPGNVGPMIVGPDGRLYFTFTPYAKSVGFLARLEADGTFTFFRAPNSCGTPQTNFVNSRNAIYFIGNNPAAGTRLCRVTYAGTFAALSSPTSHRGSNSIAADNDGNVWTVNLFGSGLYSYGASTGTIVGPYEFGTLDELTGAVAIGPDQNVWMYGYYATNQLFFGAYVRHLETFTPTTVSLSTAFPSADFYVTEPVKSAPWTAYSLNPAIATVSPASSIVGRFKVTSVAAGSTSIVVTDLYGNVRSEPVTVTTGPHP